jgi:carbamoyltransferase
VDDLCDAARRVILDSCDGASEHLSLFRAQRNMIEPIEIHTTAQWLEGEGTGMSRFFSLGGMYSAAARQIFGDPMDAGKVMGLAPYGKPRIPVEEFLVFDGNRIRFPNLVQRRFSDQKRWPAHKQNYQDLAASVQQALELALLRVAVHLRDLTKESNLCLGGGVALNSVANQRLCLEAGFERVYIVPSAEDSGVAIGAAYLGLWQLGRAHAYRQIRNDARGRTNTASAIESAIQATPDIFACKPRDLLDEAATRLSQGQIGGWFQGGSELGPRALGQRSIVCSPCGRQTKDILNARVKFRESFRPFAPAVLAQHAADWFDFDDSPTESPFMLRVVPFRPERRECVPAVVHVDGTGRVQTLTAEDNGSFYNLVAHFHDKTGVPMLLNTSMNIHSEPIVETPADALWCLLGTGLDFCVIHDWLIMRSKDFTTILDYVPTVVAEEYTLRMSISGHALQTSIHREDAVTLRIATPWGKADTFLPLQLLPLLSKIDGSRDGHALLRALPDSPSTQSVMNCLLLLRRMHVIRLSPPHVSHY